MKATTAADFIPERLSLPLLRQEVQGCRGCNLFRHATQAVFGEGPKPSRIMLVGEQPGDQEDRQGRPFVGPAGKLLDRALEEAGLDRSQVYVTNAVKHFKFEERGKRRLHKKPRVSEVNACRPWLEAEISLIKPDVIVCLGATAARSILGAKYRLTEERGKFVDHAWARFVTATVHPSSVLRALDAQQRRQQYREFVKDLKRVSEMLKSAA